MFKIVKFWHCFMYIFIGLVVEAFPKAKYNMIILTFNNYIDFIISV